MSSADLAIETRNLTKRYGQVRALDSMSLRVERGEIMGFLGPNGAGKTTTIRLLLDLVRPTSGTARVFGIDCQANSMAVRRRVGYLSSDLELYQGMTAHRMLELFASLRPEGDVDWEYVDALCSRLDVAVDRNMRGLSRGNRQKVGLVTALMARPDLLILDEPTTGLDPLVQRQVHGVLQDARMRGQTVFFSSHVLSEVEQVCDRVAIIRSGRVVAVEEVSALRRRRLQRMRINFLEMAPVDGFGAIPGVRIIDRADRSIVLEISGDLDPVVKAAARHRVAEIETLQPSLEETFMTFYGADDAVSTSRQVAR